MRAAFVIAIACLWAVVGSSPEARAQARKKGRRSGAVAAGGRGSAAPAVLVGHEPGKLVRALEFSPDGSTLASGGADRTVRLWDVATGRERAVLRGFEDEVFGLAFSPDGTTLATLDEGTIRLWDVAAAREKAAPKVKASGTGWFLGFTPDGKALVVGRGRSAGLVDLASGEEVEGKASPELTDSVFSLAVARGSGLVAYGAFTADGTRRGMALWDPATGRAGPQLRGMDFSPWAVAFSPDGRLVAAAGTHSSNYVVGGTHAAEGGLKIWEVRTGRLLGALPYNPDAGVGAVLHPWYRSLAFSPDGSLLAAPTVNGSIEFWDVASFEPRDVQRVHDPGQGRSTLASVAFSPDGWTMATGGEDGAVRLWVVPTSPARPAPTPRAAVPVGEVRKFEGHAEALTSVAFSRDGRRIVTGSDDKTARVWDAATGKELLRIEGHDEPIHAVAFARDGLRVATASTDKTARVWDAKTGKLLAKLEGHEGIVDDVDFSPDGLRVATADWDRTAKLWDASTGKLLRTFSGHGDAVVGLAFLPDGRKILTGSWDHTARLWDVADGKEIRVLNGHADKVGRLAVSADGRRALTGCSDGTMRLWDLSKGTTLTTFQVGADAGWTVALSPDGRRALCGKDNDVALFDCASGQLIEALKGHTAPVRGVAFSPDGRMAASASADKTARLWRLPADAGRR